MKPYSELTRQGKIRRLRQVALRACEQYDFSVKSLRFVAWQFNTIFRVDTDDGRVFALRVHPPNMHDTQKIRSEMLFVDSLRTVEGIQAAYPVRNQHDQFVTSVNVASVPGTHHVVLMDWLYGRAVRDVLTDDHMVEMGRMLGRLHNHAAQFEPPDDFMTDDFRLWAWGEPYYLTGTSDLLTPQQQHLFQETVARLGGWEKSLGDTRLLLHGDFHFKNIMAYRSQLFVYDFDDCGWGHPIMDIAVTIHWMRWLEQSPSHLTPLFLQGYEAVRGITFDEQDLETAVIWRELSALNYFIHWRPHHRDKGILQATTHFQRWLDSGVG